MSTLLEMPRISECSVDGCSYNHDGCHAFAVTIADKGEGAACATFIPLSVKGGLDMVIAQVGACQRTACQHNEALECSAPAVRIGPGADKADCLTFNSR
jgi:Domain of Unknown Function (DUF1540)